MIRVIVVDDEKVIREGIGRFIRETEGFTLLKTCENGETAFEAIIKSDPDLVISDIIMPKCDGIELIGKCRKKDIKCEFVLLSGYSEFEYARSAIRYGVLDYINKPINPSVLRTLLKKASGVIEEKCRLDKKLRFDIYDRMIDSRGMIHENEEVNQHSQKLPHRVLVINSMPEKNISNRLADETVTVEACEEILNKIACDQYIVYSKNGLLIVILVGTDTKEDAVKNICARILQYSRERGISSVIGIGDTVGEMQDIPGSYQKAKAALYDAQYNGIKLCFFESLSYSYVNPAELYGRDFSSMVSVIHLKDGPSIISEAGGIIERYRKSSPPYVSYSFIGRCARELMSEWEENPSPEAARNRKEKLVQMTAASSIEQLLEYFEELVLFVCEAGRESAHACYGGTMDEVIRYIHLHYTSDISIEKICNVFYFNQSYFSALFKSKTGSNYNDYVTALRVDRAKELLRTGSYKVSEIAGLVGYNSSRYFSKVFKTRTGELPQEYKSHYITKI